MIEKQDIKDLLDLTANIIDGLLADLETGHHEGNNVAFDEFSKKHPFTMKAISDLSNWVNKMDDKYESTH